MNQGQNAAAQPFLQWLQGVQLAEYVDLYFGTPAVVGSVVGRRYLRSAYRYVIDEYLRGFCFGGAFTDQNFLANDGLFSMNIPAGNAAAGFPDLLVDLVRLGNSLLVHYRLGGVAALYTDHLHYIITNPPPAVLTAAALVFQERFIMLVRYHFSYSSTAALRALFSSLAKARQYLGHLAAVTYDTLVEQAWQNLGMGNHPNVRNWCGILLFNPVFWEIMMHRRIGTQQRYLGYQCTSQSIYRFGRNDEVHAPEQTLGFFPVGPPQQTAAPAGYGHWQYVYYPAQGHWQWDFIAAQGQWNWPTVPIHPQWRTRWGPAAPVLLPQAATPYHLNTYHPQIGQQMHSPDQPSLMLGKELGIFYAHASALLLILLQAAPGEGEYIDVPYNLYRTAMDSPP